MTIPHNHVRASDHPARHTYYTSDWYWFQSEVDERDARRYDRLGKSDAANACRNSALSYRAVARSHFEHGL